MNTSLTWTINKYGCRWFQSNIIIDEEMPIVRTLTTPPREITIVRTLTTPPKEIPIVRTLTTPPKEIQSKKHNDNYADDYITS